MIVWINGAFSVGKTSAARELARRWPAAVIFDPEKIGFLLRKLVPGDAQTGDFQDLRLWRLLTVEVCTGLLELTRRPLIVPMTILNERYFDEVVGELRRRGTDVRHFGLTADPATLKRRIAFRFSSPRDKRWARQHIERACAALSLPIFSPHVKTDGLSISGVAGQIAAHLPSPLPNTLVKGE